MKTIKSAVFIILLLVGFMSCSNDDVIIEENQGINQNEQNKKLILFEQSYNEWLSTRARLSIAGKSEEILGTNDLIVDQAYDFLLAFGYDERQLKKDLKTNEEMVIAKAINLYINEK